MREFIAGFKDAFKGIADIFREIANLEGLGFLIGFLTIIAALTTTIMGIVFLISKI